MSEILLETGTGEVEIIEFVVSQKLYAINVLKVKGIVQLDKIIELPRSVPEVRGMTNIRGRSHVVIDLQMVLHNQKTEVYTDKLGLLCEFNGTIVVFLVEEVKGIVKVTWEDIKQVHQAKEDALMIGSVLKDKRIIILLDFEAITIRAELGQGYRTQKSKDGVVKKRDAKIVFAEDSRAIRDMVKGALMDSGFTDIAVFENGKDAYDYLLSLKQKHGEAFCNAVDLLITDVEMPVLDGYTLTRKVKEDEMMKQLPVIIFSSLISDELKHKGIAVGADIQIGKPSINELIRVIEDAL